jgi:hypothetical protein
MKVRTIRDHYNRYGASYFKSGSAGPVYDVPDRVGKNLIAAGYVEKVGQKPAKKGDNILDSVNQ